MHAPILSPFCVAEKGLELRGFVGLNGGGAETNGVEPGLFVVVRSEAIDEDIELGLASDVDDGYFEIAAIEGDGEGVERGDDFVEMIGGDGFGHHVGGGLDGFERGELFDAGVDVGTADHVVALERFGDGFGGSGFPVEVEMDDLRSGEEVKGVVETGEVFVIRGEGVVLEDEGAIGGGANVEFDPMNAHFYRRADGFERVFGMMFVGGAVCDDTDRNGRGGGEEGEG